jgi:hypothetical protein
MVRCNGVSTLAIVMSHLAMNASPGCPHWQVNRGVFRICLRKAEFGQEQSVVAGESGLSTSELGGTRGKVENI